MTFERSELACPVCGMDLCKAIVPAGVELWCGFGPCASQAANDGATAATELEAHKILDRNVRIENSGRVEE